MPNRLAARFPFPTHLVSIIDVRAAEKTPSINKKVIFVWASASCRELAATLKYLTFTSIMARPDCITTRFVTGIARGRQQCRAQGASCAPSRPQRPFELT
ncbi:MAG TPA: hypothetical protein VFE79_15635 [Paraburkholderia sp.]|nr:hypothetical protein [Paraburkholderia sp.]